MIELTKNQIETLKIIRDREIYFKYKTFSLQYGDECPRLVFLGLIELGQLEGAPRGKWYVLTFAGHVVLAHFLNAETKSASTPADLGAPAI
uniref:Uncharacterized protein n=1 Tax=viral metagenome TaxID=1070528 RepID=A0A6M3IZ80_9ZZZZ